MCQGNLFEFRKLSKPCDINDSFPRCHEEWRRASRHGQLNVCDLAGSERLSKSGAHIGRWGTCQVLLTSFKVHSKLTAHALLRDHFLTKRGTLTRALAHCVKRHRETAKRRESHSVSRVETDLLTEGQPKWQLENTSSEDDAASSSSP